MTTRRKRGEYDEDHEWAQKIATMDEEELDFLLHDLRTDGVGCPEDAALLTALAIERLHALADAQFAWGGEREGQAG